MIPSPNAIGNTVSDAPLLSAGLGGTMLIAAVKGLWPIKVIDYNHVGVRTYWGQPYKKGTMIPRAILAPGRHYHFPGVQNIHEISVADHLTPLGELKVNDDNKQQVSIEASLGWNVGDPTQVNLPIEVEEPEGDETFERSKPTFEIEVTDRFPVEALFRVKKGDANTLQEVMIKNGRNILRQVVDGQQISYMKEYEEVTGKFQQMFGPAAARYGVVFRELLIEEVTESMGEMVRQGGNNARSVIGSGVVPLTGNGSS